MLNPNSVTPESSILKNFANALELFEQSNKDNRKNAISHLCQVFKSFDFTHLIAAKTPSDGEEILQSLAEIIPKVISLCLKLGLVDEYYDLFYEVITVGSYGIKSFFEIHYLLVDFACQKALGDFFAHELHNSETYFTLNSGKMREAIGYAINSYHYALQIAKTDLQKNEIYEILKHLEKDIWEYINMLQATGETEDLQKLWINTEQFLAKIAISNIQRLQTEEDAQSLKRNIESFELPYLTIDIFCQEVIRSSGNIREQILFKTQDSSLEKIEQLANQGFLPLAKFCSQVFIKRCQQKNWKIAPENMSRLLALQNRTYESQDKFAPRWQDYYQKLHNIRNETPKWMQQKTTADDKNFFDDKNNFAEKAEYAETKLNQEFISLLRNITTDIIKQLGELPKACDFYLLSLGSLSIGCGAFFSDIESCLALSERYPQNEIYFTRFLFALEMTIRLLGEDESSFRAGFHLDEDIRPQISNNLYARADKFIPELPNNPVPTENRLEEDQTLTDGIRFSLMTPNVIYKHQVTKQPLLESYFAGRKAFNEQDFDLKKYPLPFADKNVKTIKYRQACALALLAMRDINHVRRKTEQNHAIIWQSEYNPFDETNKSVDIKSHFTKFLRCFILDLLWYHNLHWTWEQLTTASQIPINYLLQKQTIYGVVDLLCESKQPILNKSFGKMLKKAVAFTSIIRNRQQWYREGQFKPETVLLSEETEEAGYSLNPDEVRTLTAIETSLIRPMYEVLTYWIDTKQLFTKIDNMQDFHIAKAHLEITIEKLSQQKISENTGKYLKMLQGLPDVLLGKQFRAVFENSHFAKAAKSWSAQNGEWENCTKTEENLKNSLVIMTKEYSKHSKPAKVLLKLKWESPKGLTALNKIVSIETRVSIINCLDFGKLEDEKYQKAILSSLGECDRVRQLTLLNCQVLTNKLFEQIITFFPELEILKITGCSPISGRGITAISKLSKLKELYANNIKEITTFSITKPMHELQFILLNSCPQLSTIRLGALIPKLTKIEVCNCPRLDPKLFTYYPKQRGILNTFKLDSDPKLAIFYFCRGEFNYDLSDYKKAKENYSKAIELDPKDAIAYRNRGLAKINLGNYQAAIEDYDKAIELDLKAAIAYHNRGIAKSKVGNYQAAIKDYDNAIKLSKKDGLTLLCRGNAWWLKGGWYQELAIQDYQQAIQLWGYSARGSYSIAQRLECMHSQSVKLQNRAVLPPELNVANLQLDHLIRYWYCIDEIETGLEIALGNEKLKIEVIDKSRLGKTDAEIMTKLCDYLESQNLNDKIYAAYVLGNISLEIAKCFKVKINNYQLKTKAKLTLFGKNDSGITKKIGKKIIRQIDLESLSQPELQQFLQLPRISKNWYILFRESELQTFRTEAWESLHPSQ